MDRDTLKLLRRQARIKGRTAPWVAKLPDDELEFVYDQIRSGASNRGIARALKAKLPLTGSENSIAQSVAKLRKRTLSSVQSSPLPTAWEPADSLQQADNEVRESSQETELERIKRVESSYAELIETEIAKAKSRGLIPPDLAKHVKALAEFTKVRHRLENAPVGKTWPGPETDEQLEMERKSKVVLKHLIGDDSMRFIRGTHKFLDEMMDRIPTYEVDLVTGEILSEEGPEI